MHDLSECQMRQNAERLMGILAGVMNENGEDKSSKAYDLFRKLDTCLRDGLYVEMNRFGLGEGPEAVTISRQLLKRAETACRFPELMKQDVVWLVVPYINFAFRGDSSGLIDPIPEIGETRTVVPILAMHGRQLKIEYVNYADNRREISLADYAFVNEWAYRLGGLQLKRLIKNFIITAPQVSGRSAVLVTAHRGDFATVDALHLPIVERLRPFIWKKLRGRPAKKPPFLNASSVYLGLKEQMESVNVLVRSGIWRDEYQARIVSKALTEDLVRRDGGDEREKSFFGRYRDEAAAAMQRCGEQLKVLGQILKSAEEIVDELRRELHDFYYKTSKRLPRPDFVMGSLCCILESYESTGQNPAEYLARIQLYGYDPEVDKRVVNALARGRDVRNARRIDTDSLVEDGERKLRARKSEEPITPTAVQLVPFKMAAAYGNITALARLAEIFYDTGRYAHNRKITDPEEIGDAQTLKFILFRLLDRGYEPEENRKRILHIRRCLGEVKGDEVRRHGAHAVAAEKGRADQNDFVVLEDVLRQEGRTEVDYDENMNYRSRRTHVRTTSTDCCFVTTAALGALSVGAYETAKAFVLMKRLRDARMMKSDRGRVLLSTYYKIAPVLVDEINSRPDCSQYYSRIWNNYISPCCKNVKQGRLDAAERLYTEMVTHLLFSQDKNMVRQVKLG